MHFVFYPQGLKAILAAMNGRSSTEHDAGASCEAAEENLLADGILLFPESPLTEPCDHGERSEECPKPAACGQASRSPVPT